MKDFSNNQKNETFSSKDALQYLERMNSVGLMDALKFISKIK